MLNVDAGAKRFVALLLAPLFLLLKTKLGVDVPESVQDLLVVSVITYVGGSHVKEAIVKKAEAAGAKAAGDMKPGPEADAVVDAAAGRTP